MGGYGTETTGYINPVPGEKKSFGVKGQGTGSNMGYMYPPESEPCTIKIIGISVFAKDPAFKQTASDELVITVSSESASTHELTAAANPSFLSTFEASSIKI